jgi:hypothetical protein
LAEQKEEMNLCDLKVIGISGNRGSGKDTFCRLLQERSPRFKRYAFADALKEDLRPFLSAYFDINVNNCTAAQKEIIRPILIAYGCAQRAVQADYWAMRVYWQIAAQFDNRAIKDFIPIPIVTDVRFMNEVEMLRNNFGKNFIHVDIVREDGPPPTDEEEKHFRGVHKLADYYMLWGKNEKGEQERFVDLFLQNYPQLLQT